MSIERNELVGRTIRAWREECGMTQVELGRRVGRSQSDIAKIEMGERTLPYIESFVFCDALGKDYVLLAQEVNASLLEHGIDPGTPDIDDEGTVDGQDVGIATSDGTPGAERLS